jgi:nucleotide-binding universal stress UspA family protein
MERATMSIVQRILVPVDFSDCARSACASAVALAERTRASVDLMHVHDLGHAAWAWAPLDVLAFDNGRSLLGDAIGASHTLTRWVEELGRQSSVPIRARIEHGDPRHTIIEVARRDRYDLIVMGTHGRTGMSLLLLGSLTRDVMRRAPCPVLTVHPTEPREAPAKRVTARLA